MGGHDLCESTVGHRIGVPFWIELDEYGVVPLHYDQGTTFGTRGRLDCADTGVT